MCKLKDVTAWYENQGCQKLNDLLLHMTDSRAGEVYVENFSDVGHVAEDSATRAKIIRMFNADSWNWRLVEKNNELVAIKS